MDLSGSRLQKKNIESSTLRKKLGFSDWQRACYKQMAMRCKTLASTKSISWVVMKNNSRKPKKKPWFCQSFFLGSSSKKTKKKHLEKTKKTKNIFRNSCIRGSLNHESLNMFLVVVLFFFFFWGGVFSRLFWRSDLVHIEGVSSHKWKMKHMM